MFKKNQLLSLTITEQALKGEGVAYTHGYRILVPQSLPGDTVRCAIIYAKPPHYRARIVSVLVQSKDHVLPRCAVATRCGGCQLQHQAITKQRHFKKTHLAATLAKVHPHPLPRLLPIQYHTSSWSFRTRMQWAAARCSRTQRLQLGLYAARSHTVIPTTHCPIIFPEMNAVLTCLYRCDQADPLAVYNEQTQQGVLRFVTVILSAATREVMILFTLATSATLPQSWQKQLCALPGAASLQVTIQGDGTSDAVLGTAPRVWWGKATLQDRCAGFEYPVVAETFLQRHAHMRDRLYRYSVQACLAEGAQSVLELYCGVGMVSLMLAQQGVSVVGVESNKAAITAAKAAAQAAGITPSFVCMDVETYLTTTPISSSCCIYLNPPRAGLSACVIATLLAIKPKRVVITTCMYTVLFAQCRPWFEAGFRFTDVQPLDLFCHTPHLEVIVTGGFMR